MRVLVLGHSDSAGVQLSDPSLAWPPLLRGLLNARSQHPWEVKHMVFVPLRADATDAAQAAVDAFEPDLVMVHLNPYSFAIQVVGLRVRHRFGRRAGNLYRKWEYRFDRATSQGRIRVPLNHAARWCARHFIGVAAISSYAAVVDAYTSVLRQLAQDESLQVVVMGGNRLGAAVQSVTPGMTAAIVSFSTEMERVARAHHFVWFDTETSVAGPERDAMFLADGVHRTPLGHQRLATMLVPILETMAAAEPERDRTIPARASGFASARR